MAMRVRAYRFRAYSSKTTAEVLKTQLEAACKQAKRKRAEPEKRRGGIAWSGG